MTGRTFTKRKITAEKWHTMADGSLTGIIRVDITQTDDKNQELGTKYYLGSVAVAGEPYKDAKNIIDTGLEIPEESVKEMEKTWQEQKQAV